LRYYLRSREIEDDFQSLCDLLVSDRLKTCLPQGMLNHVLSQEGDSWFKPERLAYLADTYVSNHANMSLAVNLLATQTCHIEDLVHEEWIKHTEGHKDFSLMVQV